MLIVIFLDIQKRRKKYMNKKIVLGSVDLTSVADGFHWYPIVTKFNYEERYINNIIESVEGTEFEKLIEDYYVPIKYIKDKVKLVDGHEKDKIHKIKGCFSNYVFIKCKMTGTLWNLLRTTTGVAVVLSTGGIPVPLTEDEINNIKEKQKMEGFTKEEQQQFIAKLVNKFAVSM